MRCIICGTRDAALAWPGSQLHLCEACDVRWSNSPECARARVTDASRIASAVMDFVTRVKAEQANARKA